MPSPEPILLALDTSGDWASCALFLGERRLAEREEKLGRNLSEKLLAIVEQVLGEGHATLEDLWAIAVTTGPGSFTGLRVGLATVKGLSAAREGALPVVSVGTLEALAFGAKAQGLVAPSLDARNGILLAALYECSGEPGPARRIHEVEAPRVVGAGEWARALLERSAPVTFVGSGVGAQESELRKNLHSHFHREEGAGHPHARWVGELGRRYFAEKKTVPAEDALPFYLQAAEYKKMDS